MPDLEPLKAKALQGHFEVAEKCGLGGKSTKWQVTSPEGDLKRGGNRDLSNPAFTLL
ncbi:MAG: hypothetical protein WCO60_18690 [Verrucomicrobiota bacterium]